MRLPGVSLPLLLFFLCIITSCSIISKNSGYDANPVFTPFHEKAGEIKVSAGYGRVLGIQSNVSYSLSNRLAIMAGGVYNHQTIFTLGVMDVIYFKMKSHYSEAGLGYYFPVKGKTFTQVEMFAGLGSGIISKKTDFDRDFSGSYSEYSGNFRKLFLQISAKKSVSGDFEIGYANRVSLLKFNKLNFDYYTDSARFKNRNTVVTEPVIIFNYGKRLKFTSQCGLAIPLTKSFINNNETYPNVSALFQLGMKYNIR